MSSSFVVNETNKLAKDNLIEKRNDKLDRRRTNLRLTDDGWRRFALLAKIRPEVNNLHFDCLSVQSFEQVRKTVPQLIHSTDRALSLLRTAFPNSKPSDKAQRVRRSG